MVYAWVWLSMIEYECVWMRMNVYECVWMVYAWRRVSFTGLPGCCVSSRGKKLKENSLPRHYKTLTLCTWLRMCVSFWRFFRGSLIMPSVTRCIFLRASHANLHRHRYRHRYRHIYRHTFLRVTVPFAIRQCLECLPCVCMPDMCLYVWHIATGSVWYRHMFRNCLLQCAKGNVIFGKERYTKKALNQKDLIQTHLTLPVAMCLIP